MSSQNPEIPLAQNLSPEVLTDFNLVRAEGITELVGQIVLVFNETTLAEIKCPFNLQVFVNTTITNRVSADVTDAKLLFEPSSSNPSPIPGKLVASNALLFGSVTFGGTGPVRCRITNVRVNAAALGSPSGQLHPIVATVLMHPVFQKSVSVTVGMVKRGLASRVWSDNSGQGPPFRFEQSKGINDSLVRDASRGNAATSFYATFSEQQPSAFKTQAQESGLESVTGTRLKAVFNHIPANVLVFVTTRDVPSFGDSSVKAVLIPGEVGDWKANAEMIPPGSGASTGGIPIQQLPVIGETAWEWGSQNPDSAMTLDDVDFGIVLAAETGKALLGTATVQLSLAPTSTVTVASDSCPVPRFADWSTEIPAFMIEPDCP